jgi:hypothetical protein
MEFLPAPTPWDTSWGAITAKDELKYTYSITRGGKTINGFAKGHIKLDNGTPSIQGAYYQLPPVEPFDGYFEMRRQKTDKDLIWFPKDDKQ